MGQTKTHLVAIQYGVNDTVLNVIKVFNIDDNKYKELLNKKFLYEQEQLDEKARLLNRITTLEKQIKELTDEIKVLKGEWYE